ncbi:unnamed protein product [Allacma fusca]|uniref:Triacylglycerol lipase n=1 Tax=Allacma fusca TaxID=39272 RepID=A0A8J2JJW5_9HEXA|nr:unnamed protein product [Allacma fusca]
MKGEDSLLTVLLRYFEPLSRSSARTSEQLISIEQSGRCQMYDFGKEGNLEHYGTPQPALYYLRNVTAQCMFVYSESDKFAQPENTARTLAELGNSKSFMYEVKSKEFAHLDYILDDEVKPLVYDKVVEFFGQN